MSRDTSLHDDDTIPYGARGARREHHRSRRLRHSPRRCASTAPTGRHGTDLDDDSGDNHVPVERARPNRMASTHVQHPVHRHGRRHHRILRHLWTRLGGRTGRHRTHHQHALNHATMATLWMDRRVNLRPGRQHLRRHCRRIGPAGDVLLRAELCCRGMDGRRPVLRRKRRNDHPLLRVSTSVAADGHCRRSSSSDDDNDRRLRCNTPADKVTSRRLRRRCQRPAPLLALVVRSR